MTAKTHKMLFTPIRIGAITLKHRIVLPSLRRLRAVAYTVLRHNGVEVGKMDFLGSIHRIDP
jgi:hypothetical protein